MLGLHFQHALCPGVHTVHPPGRNTGGQNSCTPKWSTSSICIGSEVTFGELLLSLSEINFPEGGLRWALLPNLLSNTWTARVPLIFTAAFLKNEGNILYSGNGITCPFFKLMARMKAFHCARLTACPPHALIPMRSALDCPVYVSPVASLRTALHSVFLFLTFKSAVSLSSLGFVLLPL